MLGIIKRNVSYKSKEVITKLYNSYVRPHIEYCGPSWSPYYAQDLDILERVQRRGTKLIPGIRELEYEDRFRELDMFSVNRRFLRGDMIYMYKMSMDVDNTMWNELFELDEGQRTRGHSK